MWALLAAVALGAQIEIAATDGALHPGVPAQVLVAVTDDAGAPADRPPQVEVPGGSVRLDGVRSPGIWSYQVVPPADVEKVRFDITALGRIATHLVPVEPIPEPSLEVDRRIDALAGADQVRFLVTAEDLPPPEALMVATGVGRVDAVRPVDGGLEVTLEPGPSPFPRYVPVGLLDARHPTRPAWSGLRLRTRPRIALQTEPGTTLELQVGSRGYGPFEADDEGIVAGTIDQYPGEMVAQAVLTDDLGNETATSLPLSSHTQPALVALPSGAIVPGRPPPPVYLRAVHGDGHPWQTSDPVCRTPSYGELGVHGLEPGTWLLPLQELRPGEVVDLRIHCSLGGAAEASFRVPLAENQADRLRLRVWPEELSTDFPVAEVRVILEDARGERMPVRGIEVEAERGRVEMEPPDGFVGRGEYRGEAAVDQGGDVIHARWRLPPGEGWVDRLTAGHGRVPEGGELLAYGRALDARGRPLAGVDIALEAGAEPAYATTGADGWAGAAVPLPEGAGPVVVEARHGSRMARTVVLRGAAGSGGAGTPELVASRAVPITAGRGTDVFVSVDPPVLYTSGNAMAWVDVAVVDRAGNPVTDAVVDLEASEGTVGPVRRAGDGYRAEYVPPPGDKPREVSLTARYESASATARLILEPRPVERAVGVSFGALSNFGEITSPLLSVDVDLRTPFFDNALMLRLGVGTYGDAARVDTELGDEARIRMTLFPVTVGLLGRRDNGGRALWLGLGGVIAPYRLDARFGDDQAARGLGVLPPGLELIGGVGQRFGGGEVMLELRALTLSSPGGPISYQGPVGGVAAVLGYRLVY